MKTFVVWITLAFVLSICCGLAYLLVQQNIRISANYPQMQMAEDTLPSVSDIGLQQVNIETSIAPFVSVFDAQGTVRASNAVIMGGATPVPPSGVFDYAHIHGEDRFTWEPKSGVRIAAVLVYHNDGRTSSPGFVLAGRSLREVEILESDLARDTGIVWIIGLIISFFLSFLMVRVITQRRSDYQVIREQHDSPVTPPHA